MTDYKRLYELCLIRLEKIGLKYLAPKKRYNRKINILRNAVLIFNSTKSINIGNYSLTIDSLSYFSKSIKSKNDEYNKHRELIIYSVLRYYIPNGWYLLSLDWFNFRNKLRTALNEYVFIDIKYLAGMKNRYDFLLIGQEREYKIEFKYGARMIEKIPEFLSIGSNKFPRGISYAEFYYDNYLSPVLNLYGIETLPDKQLYLSKIHSTKCNIQEINNLRIQEKKLSVEMKMRKKEKKEIVDQSINDYLTQFYENFSIDELNSIITNDKIYLFYYENNFSICEAKLDFEIISIDRIHNSNTIECSTRTKKIYCLLRWKNCAGVLFPAWQISLRDK